MKIIYATDFSEQAVLAGRVAGRMAQRLGDSVLLVNVVEPLTTSYPELAMDARVFEKAVREKTSKDIAVAAEAMRAQGVEVETKILEGQPAAEAIAACGKEVGARLIVLGTHGRRAVKRFFLGSVAERTVLAADRPVLVVRDGGEGFDEWIESERPLKVLVALDGSRSSRAAVDWVKDLRKVAACDVTFLHVYWPPERYAQFGLGGPRDVFQPDAETIRILERDFWAQIGEMPGRGKTSLRIVPNWGAPAELLALDAKEEHADLLVMGTHQRHGLRRFWLGSTTHGTLRAASLPVLCVPSISASASAPTEIPRIVTVLAPTDLSELGNAGVLHAYSMIGGGGIVELCHVHERSLPSPIYAYAPGPEGVLSPERRKEIEQRLAALIPPDAEPRRIWTRIKVVEATSPAEGILQTARRLGVDAVCLASHGRSGLGKGVLGSVAASVVEGADRPVLVVRRPRD